MGLKIRKGDSVEVISGDERGAIGNVLQVYSKKNKALVQGVNLMRKHEKARSEKQPGGIIEKEAPIQCSKLQLVDPKSGRGGRYNTVIAANGQKARKMKRSGNEV